ncbi:MAG: cyclase family protein [Acidobacteria bacterium]|nr:cyclase family protein [Acidobacteriota bacterium]
MKIYDVSVPIGKQTPVYEGDPKVEIETANAIARGDAANVSRLCFGAHTATHIDAPNHFIEGTRKVDKLPLEVLIGKVRVVEIDKNAAAIESSHIENANLKGVERVLFKTRNSEFWNDLGQDFRKDFTYIAPDAAQKLVESGAKLVGIDYLSVEKFGSEDFATHIILLKNQVIIIEGLDLREISAGDYELICLPLKIADGTGDGAPARTVLRELK